MAMMATEIPKNGPDKRQALGPAAVPSRMHGGVVIAGEPQATVRWWQPFATLWRASWVRKNENLSAQDAASTFFRFFRSEHVADLRIIFRVVLTLVVLHFIAVCVLAIQDLPTADAKVRPALEFSHTLITYFGPALPIYGAIMAWTYLSAGTRLGVVDLFACEIRTLCRVGAVFDIGTVYVEQHARCLKMIENSEAEKPLFEERSSSESKEEYFPVFSNNSHDLEALEATVVGNITEFYTYMKAARDLQRKLENEPAKIVQPILENLIYVLFLGYESARKAIKDLIEFQPARAENILVVLLTELPCYGFLRDQFKGNEKAQLRRERLNLREVDYMEEVPRLARRVERHAKETDWIAAEKSILELGKRYKAALGEDLERGMVRIEEEDKRRTQAALPS